MTTPLHLHLPRAGRPPYTLTPERHLRKNSNLFSCNFCQNSVSSGACFSILLPLWPSLRSFFCPFFINLVIPLLSTFGPDCLQKDAYSHRKGRKESHWIKHRCHERKDCLLGYPIRHPFVRTATHFQLVVIHIPIRMPRSDDVWGSASKVLFLASDLSPSRMLPVSKSSLQIHFNKSNPPTFRVVLTSL